jgi:hypothetical protein
MGHSFLYAHQNTGLLWHTAVRPSVHASYDNISHLFSLLLIGHVVTYIVIFGQIIFQNFHQFKAFVGLLDYRTIGPSDYRTVGLSAEAKSNKSPLYVAFMDARKAFDVVWHTGLFRDLYTFGITGHGL